MPSLPQRRTAPGPTVNIFDNITSIEKQISWAKLALQTEARGQLIIIRFELSAFNKISYSSAYSEHIPGNA